MSTTSIEWTDTVWNPVSGCTRVSAGCDHCYAVDQTHMRGANPMPVMQKKYAGLTVLNGKGDRHFNGIVRTHDDTLAVPLGWKKPRRVFVNSMSDLFHKDVPFEFVDKVFAVMALCPQHTFQVLTKRPERMAEYTNRTGRSITYLDDAARTLGYTLRFDTGNGHPLGLVRWPLPNVWLGTSVENQKAADERIPHLLRCPAAVRFLSCEPLLGAVDLMGTWGKVDGTTVVAAHGVDWVIVGGESGKGARVCNAEWVREIVSQCKSAGVPVFVKQLGKWIDDGKGGTSEKNKEFCIQRFLLNDGSVWVPPILRSQFCPEAYDQRPLNAVAFGLSDTKGGNPVEWPADLRVREFPEPVTA